MDPALAADIEKALIQQMRELQFQYVSEKKKKRDLQEKLLHAEEGLEKSRRDFERLSARHGRFVI